MPIAEVIINPMAVMQPIIYPGSNCTNDTEPDRSPRHTPSMDSSLVRLTVRVSMGRVEDPDHRDSVSSPLYFPATVSFLRRNDSDFLRCFQPHTAS
jgi:hypothetical protein